MERSASPSPLLALTTGLARGDDHAWDDFHREYGPEIFRYLLAAARGDADLADEALQQSYLRIARHARPCDSAPVFAAWLRVVARTAISDCRRGRRNFWGLLQRYHAAQLPSESSSEHDDQLDAALDNALAKLSPDDRALLEAKYFTRLAVRDIAEKLSLSPKAVESRLTRARDALRRELLNLLPLR
ncbi:N/A [soil metagenome]